MSDGAPMDLIALAREAGASEAKELAAQARIDSIQLITFERNRDPGRTLPIGRHPKTNRIVFPDQKRNGGSIKPGETYFCDLVEYRPPVGPPVYYANPLSKVDARFLFELEVPHLAKLVEVLSRTAQAELLEATRTQIHSELTAQSKARLDCLEAEISALRTENTALKEENARRYVIPPLLPPSPGLSDGSAITMVSRPAANELRSPLLPTGRYFVHVSPDRTHLYIHGHPEGTHPADGSGLRIPGLSVLRPFDKPEDLSARPDSRVGGIWVEIGGPKLGHI